MEKTPLEIETEKLLSEKVFSFNNRKNEKAYFPDLIKELLTEYIEVLKAHPTFWDEFFKIHYPGNYLEFKEKNYFLFNIIGLSEGISECIESYFLGRVPYAYNCLERGLNEITYSTSKLFNEAINNIEANKFNGFRIRTKPDDWDKSFRTDQMFHIPFELRHKVTTQRFSIPGHPSLYIGDSIYVCWEELNQPKLDYVYGSRFVNEKPLKIIEIICKEMLAKRLANLSSTDYSSELFRYLLTFPLNIACSIRTANRSANFKPEYIVPQLFLQFVSEKKNDIDAISYYSTRVDTSKVADVGISNFVFPSKTNEKSGHCKILKDTFILTEPLLYEHERISKENVSFLSSDPGKGSIELSGGKKVLYGWSAFKSFENALSNDSVKLYKIN